jgi:guanylate cyclase, other
MSLLDYYDWKKFSIIYEEAWEKVADALSTQAKDSNKTINHKKQVYDRHYCCENNKECCRPGYWYNVSSF